MHSAATTRAVKCCLNPSVRGSQCSSTKLSVSTRSILTLATFCALALLASKPTLAQTETVIYSFNGAAAGPIFPDTALTVDASGNLYGGTALSSPGGGFGTIFELSPAGGGGYTEITLYTFCSQPNCTDGVYPSNVIFDNQGNLYGTTNAYGLNGCGNVFELSPGVGGWTETVLYSFGSYPGDVCRPNFYGLTWDASGNLYGGASGTNCGGGGAFELSPAAGGGWTEQVIYTNGMNGGLVMDQLGNLYGGGTCDNNVFELSPNGDGGWNSTVIYAFKGGKDGSGPNSTPVLDKSGSVYGTTTGGGTKGDGTVWKLTPVTTGKKKGTFKEKILYSFKGKKDGISPNGVILDASGNLYGTTFDGGKDGYGIVFELAVSGTTYKEKILCSFDGSDGAYGAGLTLSSGNLYGTTNQGGTENNGGVAFEVTP
jgi:uncharacterized repeat protein (TIGR03803 family)